MRAETDAAPPALACFDLEGTLCTGRHIWAAIAGRRILSLATVLQVAPYVVSITGLSLANRLGGWVSYSRVSRKGLEGLASLLRGISCEQADALFEKTAQIMAASARAAVLSALQRHQQAGDTVLLVSGGFQPLVDHMARVLEVVHAIGTPLQVVAGSYTGQLAGPPLMGQVKVKAVRQYLEDHSLRVDWSRSYAYGDRFTDMPILESVGHPVAVHPDRKLLALARVRGWPVLG